MRNVSEADVDMLLESCRNLLCDDKLGEVTVALMEMNKSFCSPKDKFLMLLGRLRDFLKYGN